MLRYRGPYPYRGNKCLGIAHNPPNYGTPSSDLDVGALRGGWVYHSTQFSESLGQPPPAGSLG